MLTISTDDYLWFVDDCLDAMLRIVEELGDELANTTPELPAANSPFAILIHCLGVIDWWGGEMVSGRQVVRDRDAEFVASGPVSGLREKVQRTRDRLAADLRQLDPQAAPAGPREDWMADVPHGSTQGGVLLHVLHELAQHLGQMELSRDVLGAAGRAASP